MLQSLFICGVFIIPAEEKSRSTGADDVYPEPIMSLTEQDHQALQQGNVKYVFNYFNIPQPNAITNNNNNNTTDPRSPTPSIQSENSIECSLSGHNVVSDAASSCSEESEQELTNLTWLTELRNQSLTWPDSIQPIIDEDSRDRKFRTGKGSNKLLGKSSEEAVSVQQKRPSPAERYDTFLDKVKKDMAQYDLAAEIYQTCSNEKPPFNYSHIIGMAMVENGRMTLQQICSWIESKFAFFRVRKKWNNSIRHNLSLHHCFRKIDRSKYEKGKGGYWELGIDPRKCDRKRIRNRKTSKNRSAGDIKDRSQITETQMDGHDVTTPCSQAEQAEEFVLDELDVQQNIVIPKDSRDSAINQEFLTANLTPNDSRLRQYDINNAIQLQDVFIADVSGCGKVMTSANLATGAEYQLGTIIVNSSASDIAGPSVNISEIQQQMNVFVEEQIPQACENVVISSYLSNESTGNQGQPNVIVEQMEPFYTVSTAETNFRPYIDGIDEAFQYLRNVDNRCDDLFDNLLDISVFVEEQIPQACENVVISSYLSNESTGNQGQPNVIVEQMEPFYTVSTAETNFRPYIDGIDEAFQYLRNVDNRCDDLFDNLLDISVSDY